MEIVKKAYNDNKNKIVKEVIEIKQIAGVIINTGCIYEIIKTYIRKKN